MKADRLKLHTFWNSFASNISSPFVSFNVTASGASDLLIGYVQAINTLSSGVAQLFGGRLADRYGRRVLIASVFSVVSGGLWAASALVPNPTFLAIAYTAITLAVGVYAAGWTSIVGEAAEGKEKASFIGTFARITSVGALAGLVLTTVVTAFYPSYSVLYLLSGAFFVVSAVALRGQKEQTVRKAPMPAGGVARLRSFYLASALFGFFWGFAWPLFTITIVRVVNMSLFQYSVAQVIATGSTVAFQPFLSRFVDRDRMKGVFWTRAALVIYPLAYMVAGTAWEVYALNLFAGVTNSLLNVAFVSYLYDISPAGQRGRYNAEYNLITGATTMAGSLSSALILTEISGPYNLWISLAYLYVIAAVGRGFAAFMHLRASKPNQ